MPTQNATTAEHRAGRRKLIFISITIRVKYSNAFRYVDHSISMSFGNARSLVGGVRTNEDMSLFIDSWHYNIIFLISIVGQVLRNGVPTFIVGSSEVDRGSWSARLVNSTAMKVPTFCCKLSNSIFNLIKHEKRRRIGQGRRDCQRCRGSVYWDGHAAH